MMIRCVSQILPDISMEQKVHIVHRGVIDQPIQFTGFVHIPGNLIFYPGAVDGDHAAICIFDLDTGGVDIELTRNNLTYIVLPKAKIIRTLLLLR